MVRLAIELHKLELEQFSQQKRLLKNPRPEESEKRKLELQHKEVELTKTLLLEFSISILFLGPLMALILLLDTQPFHTSETAIHLGGYSMTFVLGVLSSLTSYATFLSWSLKVAPVQEGQDRAMFV